MAQKHTRGITLMSAMNSEQDAAAQSAVGVRGLLTALAASVLLAACSGGVSGDLKQYVEEVKQRPGAEPEPLPKVAPYKSFTYDAYNLRDPFSPFYEAEPVAPTPGDGGPKPDRPKPAHLIRKKETLEQFPLDTLHYVGILEKDGVRWGLVQTGAPDNTVYKVQVGNHVGQNYGEIVAITESFIKIVELIPDGKGGWFEREASMPLNE